MVTAITLQAEAVPNVIELPGRIEAVRTAEVRARTDGIIERRLYTEGTDVGAGTPLFQLDARDYRAQVAQARAALQRAEAQRTNAAAVVSRYRPLVAERAISAQEYDSALAALRTAEANVADTRAALSRSELQLSYTIVRAPIAGRVGRAEVTEGALVSAGSATLMTRIDQMSPVYAVFTQSHADLLTMMNQAKEGELSVPGSLSRVEVRLTLENGEEYGPIGYLDFADQSIDPTTGSQTIRAQFPNVGRMLLPGQFVRGRIQAGVTPNGVAVPQRAVQISGDKATVFVIGRDNVVTPRQITLGRLLDGRWLVQSGIRPGERIVVDGWNKVQPGQKVQISPQRPAADGTPTQAPAGQAAAPAASASSQPARPAAAATTQRSAN
jgi:membrane fusion protein (multidrug efflux system)